jgi:hypothetical protein
VIDGTPPHGSLALAGRQKLRKALAKGLKLRLTLDEPARVAISLGVDKRTAKKLKLGKRATVVGKVTKSVEAGTTTLTVKFTGKARKKLKRLRKLTLTVKVVSTDAAGNAAPLSKRLSVKR